MNAEIEREQRREDVTLSRDLNLFTVTMIGVGGMVGAGIFVLTGRRSEGRWGSCPAG
ncbi:MAG: hypothetical protein P8Z41_11900 [Anaerolineales bacterium]